MNILDGFTNSLWSGVLNLQTDHWLGSCYVLFQLSRQTPLPPLWGWNLLRSESWQVEMYSPGTQFSRKPTCETRTTARYNCLTTYNPSWVEGYFSLIHYRRFRYYKSTCNKNFPPTLLLMIGKPQLSRSQTGTVMGCRRHQRPTNGTTCAGSSR